MAVCEGKLPGTQPNDRASSVSPRYSSRRVPERSGALLHSGGGWRAHLPPNSSSAGPVIGVVFMLLPVLVGAGAGDDVSGTDDLADRMSRSVKDTGGQWHTSIG